MKLFPTLSGDKETTRFSSTLFDRKTEIRKYSVETAQAVSTRTAHSPQPGA